MNITRRTSVVAIGAVLLTLAVARAQEPGGRGRGAGGRGGAADQTPEVPQVPRTPVVDPAAHDRGRSLWAVHCIDCHGSQARGSETGPNIIRTKTVNFDRSSFTPGSVLGPFLKAGHPTQSGKASASFTDEEIVGLAHFLRQRVNDTMRGSAVFTAGDILVGNAKAGEEYFHGAGGCATCHNASTRSLAGIRTRVATTVDLQQRMLFPGMGVRDRGRGAPPAANANANAVRVTVTPASGPAMSGVLVEQSDFYVTFRQTDGSIRVVRTTGAKVVTTDPLQAHIDLLDRISDTQIHDLVAYLENLK
jgi:mono/diheme cytochrome c family protein